MSSQNPSLCSTSEAKFCICYGSFRKNSVGMTSLKLEINHNKRHAINHLLKILTNKIEQIVLGNNEENNPQIPPFLPFILFNLNPPPREGSTWTNYRL